MKDGKGAFYRLLKLDRSTKQIISFYRKIAQQMKKENEERKKK